MRLKKVLIIPAMILFISTEALLFAQSGEDDESGSSTKIYGFIDSYAEKVFSIPSIDDSGETVKASDPFEYDIPNLSVMIQGTISNRYRYFLNIDGRGAGNFEANIAWIEASLYGDLLNIRTGKMYRKFGLYNEMLDAVPTYMGIEPPELFDKDHLMLTRTTNLMLYGSWSNNVGQLSYAITTGMDERQEEEIPYGMDLNFNYNNMVKIGTSFYSTGGWAVPTHSVGEGSPRGGVATWMSKDSYTVYGGYVEMDYADVILQAELWQADHSGKRDPSSVLQLLNAGLNERQLKRFGLNGASPSEGDVAVDADYNILTYYLRLGYHFDFSFGEVPRQNSVALCN